MILSLEIRNDSPPELNPNRFDIKSSMILSFLKSFVCAMLMDGVFSSYADAILINVKDSGLFNRILIRSL
jgi:hypothetical protein